MISRLESFSNEIFYEIFDCLSIYDIFHGFLGLNYRLNNLIGSYPLEIDFRKISRSKFDLICHQLQPKQVISLIFSEEDIPEQVLIFHRYFPHVKEEFISLRRLKYVKTEYILFDLPNSVSSLTFEDCDRYSYNLIIDIIIKQAQYLIDLKINRINILQSMNISFPMLTHLNIDRGVFDDIDRILKQYERSFIDFHSFISNLHSPITHLKIDIEQEILRRNKSLFNFEYLSSSLTHLTLNYHININISLELFQQYLLKLSNLKSLTLIAIGQLDLFDGKQWEKFLRQTQITKFNFKFVLSQDVILNENESILLESFRSSFWLEEKHWYVALNEKRWKQYTEKSIYSIPRFHPQCINYTENNYPPPSTAPLNIQQEIFYSKSINHLCLNFNKTINSSIYRFTHVNCLILIGSTLPSINILCSIVDLSQINELDISLIKNISIGQIHLLLEHTSHLNHLIMKNLIPLFIPPLYIHSYTIKEWEYNNDIDKFCSRFSHIKSLKIDIYSIEMMIKLINRLKYLEHVVFWYNIDKYLPFLSMRWLKRTIYRLRREKFTYQAGDYYLMLSIGNKQ